MSPPVKIEKNKVSIHTDAVRFQVGQHDLLAHGQSACGSCPSTFCGASRSCVNSNILGVLGATSEKSTQGGRVLRHCGRLLKRHVKASHLDEGMTRILGFRDLLRGRFVRFMTFTSCWVVMMLVDLHMSPSAPGPKAMHMSVFR